MVVASHWWKTGGALIGSLHAAMAGDSGGESPAAGWVWLSEHESREALARIHEANAGPEDPTRAWMNEAAVEACHAMLARAVPLAVRGEVRPDRWMRKLHQPTLFGDAARPEQVWIGLDAGTPPPLWVPAGTTVGSLTEAFAPYALPETDAPLPIISRLPRRHRIFLGTASDTGAELDDLVQFIRQSLPGTDSLPWGTRFGNDPWPDRPAGIELMSAGYQMADNLEQATADVVPTITLRSRRLGAAIAVSSLAQFHVLEVRYTPAPHPSILPILKQVLPTLPSSLPPDMPVDALSVMARFRGESASEILAHIRDPEEAANLGYHTMAYVATLGDDGAAARSALTEIASRADPAARQHAYRAASIGGHKRFLHEALLRETDPDILESLKRHLSP